MERFSASGDSTSNHPSQTPNNTTVPLDTILKDKEILSYEGPRAFESDWKQSSPSLQTSNGQILAHHQCNNESHLRKFIMSIHRQTAQSTAGLPIENYPQHEAKHFCPNDKTPETSAPAKKRFLQKCKSSSSFKHQSVSCASATTNVSQQSVPHVIALNTNTLSGSWKRNLHNQQQHVRITNNLPKDFICQGLVSDVGPFGIISAQAQTINLCQRIAFMPKDVHQQMYAPQKAIAVVAPLTQQVVADVPFTKDPTKVKEGGLETRSVPNQNDHQSYNLHTLQPKTKESGAKRLYGNTSQTKEVLATGMSHCVKDVGPIENNRLLGQNERLSSVPLNSVKIVRNEAVQPYPTDDNASVKFLGEDDITVMGGNSESTETRMDGRMDHLSTIPVNEWSLQRLRTLVMDLEQMQKKQQKEVPFNDLPSDILKMYWNGDYKNLCHAEKSNIYSDIIEEVRLQCGTENSIILHECLRERLNEMASRFHILEHGIAPPQMIYTSSWLNLSKELYDIDKEDDCLSSPMMMLYKPKLADKEVPTKEMENIHEATNEKIKASNKAVIGGEKLSKHVVMDVENTCSVKETERQDGMSVKNVKMKEALSDKQKTKDGHEGTLLVSSSTQSSDVSDRCIKQGNLLKLPTPHMPPVLDKNDFADCISADRSILLPEKTGRLFTGEPDEEVDNMQKVDAQMLRDSMDQVTLELVDQDKKHMDMEIKPDERSSRIKINGQLKNYCCVAKWFQVLGYRNRGFCKCEKKPELSHHTDAPGQVVHEVNTNKNRHPFNKACKLTDTDICVLRDKKHGQNRHGYKHMVGKKSSSINDSNLDDLEIVEVVSNYEDVVKIANAMSEQLMETPPTAHTSRESTTGRQHHRDHKKITAPEFKKGESLINLTLFGTSHLRQKKSISGFRSSDKMQPLPETITVRIDSDWKEYPNNTKSQTPKQEVWNSCKKTNMPLKMPTKKRAQKQKHAKAPESKNDKSVIKTTEFDLITTLLAREEDSQTHRSEAASKNAFSLASADKQKNTDTDHSKKKSRKKISSTRKDKIRKLKLNTILASFNLNKRWNCANNGSKPMKSSFELPTAINPSKNELNMGSALNFGVLPESFSISDGNSSMETSQSASPDGGSKVKTMMQIKRTWGVSDTWCHSPRKKQCLKSTPALPNTSGSSTFQEFKKKYEEKTKKNLT